MNANERRSAFIRVHPRLFIYSLEIVVEHSSMTNQTHLFRQLCIGRSDQGAAPRTENFEYLLLRTLQIAVARIDTLTQSYLPE
jgi:hypothetical protein